jgi:hypothetical protein
MSKARPQTGPRRTARLVQHGRNLFLRRKNNRKTTDARHNQYTADKVIRHDAK